MLGGCGQVLAKIFTLFSGRVRCLLPSTATDKAREREREGVKG